MTTRDEDLRERIKHEADELLFEGMHFDAEMQRNVRELAELDRERSRRSRRRSQQRRWLAGAGITVAAALTGLVLLFSQDGVITSPGDPPPGILVGPDDPIAPSPSGSDNELQVLKGYEEAAEAFGSTLKIPGWLPEGFALNEISVTGPRNGKAVEAAFSYVADDRSFGIFTKHVSSAPIQQTGEAVDLSGVTGFLIGGEPITSEELLIPNVELHWYEEGTYYMINGLIDGEQAIRIARSMRSETHND
ncbi:hypothetical protein JCM10914A_43070 [Paenibacillus sp. JCM 10914]|uniref:DUF4367 domain-containing protein n=1 Tax=Paenibacillus sp. JCM 10914 TaxID=1236974 RepID=UPI0003CC3E13|nr:DUF4367 domain-containing protein [Paenibacillus sp. JCM 10914]GAE05526.1 hypothetical protein JCM10914_1630 [Paenibacillus sp. JCM 10914]